MDLALPPARCLRPNPVRARDASGDWTDHRSGWFVAASAILVASVFLMDVAKSDLSLPLNSIQKWAETFGQKIYSAAERTTALTDIQTDYLLMYSEVRSQNGSQLVQELKERLETLFSRKVNAINRLVDVAEKSFYNHVMSEKLAITYPKAKNLSENFTLNKDDHFYGIPVNLTNSSIHVPTNVYDESVAILNGVAWTAALDKTFQENYRNDPSLSWQYFGSSTGFFRNYPGIRWPKLDDEVDLYDCRTRGWYIQAATSPKDMVILLDSSGSMKGLRMEIAKATVKKIVETLSDDDFFNVIKFSETPEYLEPCINGTMVQATTNNKKKIKDKLDKGIKTQNIAYFDKALTLAFELLLSMNGSDQGSQCNKAIMIITDGAPNTYEAIFKQYNWPNKDVRVFTYLIGREVGDPRHVRWMACSNKGYYSHISTLADVHEHVQEYIHVISRPMVIMRANQTVWTSIYRDTSDSILTISRPLMLHRAKVHAWTGAYEPVLSHHHDHPHNRQHSEKGVHMTISVAQPVYNTKNGTANSGDLLGVMGTDVPLEELVRQIPHHKLGVNGYAFAITNNGYVLFHPDLRPLHSDNVEKPNYNSVDIAEVELLDSASSQWDSLSGTYKQDIELRRRMIDRENGSTQMKMKVHFDNMKRATTRTYNYFFTSIDSTPFSLGIALPDGYGMYWVDGRRSLQNADLSDFRTSETPIILAEWDYCRPQDTNESQLQQFEFLMKSLERGKKDQEYFHKYCDVDLVNSLLFDAEATRAIPNSWRKENTDGTINDSTSTKNGIEMVFIATKAGLSRYLTFVENLTDPDFIGKNKNTVREVFYSRAVTGGEGVFTFSVPIPEEKTRLDPTNTVVTASSPVFVSSEDAVAVAAVAGLQMKYTNFHELLISATSQCASADGSTCNITCESEVIDCYLLDNNGFVVFSENPHEHLGRFFGEIDGLLMARLIREENRTSNQTDGIFSKIEIIDYQGMCSIWRKAHCDARSIFVDPLRNLLASLWWLLQRIILLVLSFSEFIWCTDDMVATTGDDDLSDQDRFINEIISRLMTIAPDENTFSMWKNELFNPQTVDYTSRASVEAWFRGIRFKYGPRVVGARPCYLTSRLYDSADSSLLLQGSVSNAKEYCNRSFAVVPVYRTNLHLLVIDATCSCDSNEKKIDLQPIELDPLPSANEACRDAETGDGEPCQKLEMGAYRQRPSHCFSFHKHENSTRCGAMLNVHAFSVFVLSTSTVLSVVLLLHL